MLLLPSSMAALHSVAKCAQHVYNVVVTCCNDLPTLSCVSLAIDPVGIHAPTSEHRALKSAHDPKRIPRIVPSHYSYHKSSPLPYAPHKGVCVCVAARRQPLRRRSVFVTIIIIMKLTFSQDPRECECLTSSAVSPSPLLAHSQR